MKVQETLKAAIEALEYHHLYIKQDKHAHKLCKSALSEIGECEPVAEALHERNRLGYAVVDVIGTLDEIIENAQEVEVDDFLHIAIPIDKWHELQDALEEMPKRAELYTSPISKEFVRLKISNEELLQYAVSEELLLFASEDDFLAIANGVLELVNIKLNAKKG